LVGIDHLRRVVPEHHQRPNHGCHVDRLPGTIQDQRRAAQDVARLDHGRTIRQRCGKPRSLWSRQRSPIHLDAPSVKRVRHRSPGCLNSSFWTGIVALPPVEMGKGLDEFPRRMVQDSGSTSGSRVWNISPRLPVTSRACSPLLEFDSHQAVVREAAMGNCDGVLRFAGLRPRSARRDQRLQPGFEGLEPRWVPTNLPQGFTETVVATGLSEPTAMAEAPDGRIFVCEQAGKLRVIQNGQLLATPFVSLNVDSTNERGLLGVALDPNFESNQYVYLYYTVPGSPAHNQISRFTANGNVAVLGSEVDIFNLDPLSAATNHNGGAIHFGPDNRL